MNSYFEYYKVFYYVAKYENLTKASRRSEDEPAGGDENDTQPGK